MCYVPLLNVKDFVERYKKRPKSAEFHKNRELKKDSAGLSPDELNDDYTKLLNDKFSKRPDDLVLGSQEGLLDQRYPIWYISVMALTRVLLRSSAKDSFISTITTSHCFSHGNKDILDVLDEPRKDGELIAYMNEATKPIKPNIGDFQKKTKVLCKNEGDAQMTKDS